ncbi:MAG: hypothetical protein V3V00_16620 [Saprospiraceae bacterium]
MLKKLKSLFVIEEAGGNISANTETADKNTAPSGKSSATINSSSSGKAKKSSPVVKGAPQEKFVNILLEAVEKNNLEGFDYLEYKQSLQSLSKMNMDETTQYKSAFAMASTMGVSKEKLVKSVHHYLSVLKNEETKFNQALTSQINHKVGQRKEGLKSLKDNIKNKESQINKLQKQIESHKNDLEKVKAEIENAQSKVEGTKSGFYGSYKVVASQMEKDLKKINEYL